MQPPPENIDLILPQGDSLREYLEQPFLSTADLKSLLRHRGIFICKSEKEDTIPILTCALLNPREFDWLRDRQVTREDNPKTFSRCVGWQSQKSLMESVPDLELNDLIKSDFVNYKVIGSPKFIPVAKNPDHVRLEFDIERRDLSKSWCRATSRFKGALELKKIFDGKSVKLLLTHTAAETRDLNHKITRAVTASFKASSSIGVDEELSRILFTDFANEGRVRFFWNLTAKHPGKIFEFMDVVDIGFFPDPSLPLPEELKWMESRVSELRVKGKDLHQTIFVQQPVCHKHLLFVRLDAKFRFEYHAAKGECVVSFEFADFSMDDYMQCEFETNISALVLVPECAHVNRVNVKEFLLSELDTIKLTEHLKCRIAS